ncbi:MAG: Uma2 family endonuclease [Anaerolineae bacterium]|nr:Uma2 family endonuclease [Anaerolineae bacterium]
MSDQTTIRMTAAEYFKLPESTQFEELLDGELIVSPPPLLNHQRLVLRLATLLQSLIPDGEVFIAPVALYLDEHNVPEPDVAWVAHESQCQLTRTGLQGPPDLIVEVLSASTARRDRGEKFDLYEKHGVREYWLVDPEGQYLEVYTLDHHTYRRQGVYGPQSSFDSAVLGCSVALQAIFQAS